MILFDFATAGHPGSSANPSGERVLALHEATFTTFCDTGTVEAGTCWCKGGSATAAIGDGSWLWSELVGAPCQAQQGDRCDCTDGTHCPHEGSWQCEGINAPDCSPSDVLKRCEVTVHGTHGTEKFYFTEACPSTHPCNRCKDKQLNRCASWAPLAVDVCGTTWWRVFEKWRSEATGHVTLSCYPDKYSGETDIISETVETGANDSATCVSDMAGDSKHALCQDWCSVETSKDHCKW